MFYKSCDELFGIWSPNMYGKKRARENGGALPESIPK
jgi:hypothetical protein